MSKLKFSARRWLKSTSNRTFLMWPALLLGLHFMIPSIAERMYLLALPVLAWGYLQYLIVGTYRTRRGGGGPGLSNPPERLVSEGPYGVIRNPMYLGHLVFFFGLALMFGGVAWTVLLVHALWFDRRAQADEKHLAALFGQKYRDYLLRVKRWVPGIY